MRNDLPVISGVERQFRKFPECVARRSSKFSGPGRRGGSKINVEGRWCLWGSQPDAHIVEMDVEVADAVLFEEGDADRLPTETGKVIASLLPVAD